MIKRITAVIIAMTLAVTPFFALCPSAEDFWDGKPAISFESGNGFEDDPYIIADASQLALLAGSVSSGNPHTGEYFKLANDIVLNPTDETTWFNTAKKWMPIGNPNTAFCGVFDGNGKTVRGICIDSPNDSQGLFGVVGEYGRILSLGVADASIKGNVSVGAVAGTNNGVIINCRNEGAVHAVSDGGGIAGMNNGRIAGCANLGWVGNKGNNGGITGRNDGIITDCYNNGSIDGGYLVAGGISGENRGKITNCYNAGYISSEYGKSGSLVGFNGGGTVKDCYFLDRKSALDTLGTLLSSAKMKNPESFKGFDFEKVWTIDENGEYGYPVLKGSTDFFGDTPAPPEVVFPNTEFTDESSRESVPPSVIEPEAQPFPAWIIVVIVAILAVIVTAVVIVVKKRR